MARPRNGVTFWDRVNAHIFLNENGCVEFKGCCDDNGYGRINKNGKLVRLHREAWAKSYGDIPNGMCVCHKCDNPSCINVEHLFLGTHADNMRDKANKGRVDVRGGKNPSAILDEIKVKIIKNRIRNGETCYSLGREYGVTGEAILAIKHGRTWGNVQC